MHVRRFYVALAALIISNPSLGAVGIGSVFGLTRVVIRVENLYGGGLNLSGNGDQVGPTNRARVVRGQPGVDALGVENVAAFGEQTQRFVVFELVQAHGALERVLADLEPLDGGVHEGWEVPDCGRVEATRHAGASVASAGADGEVEAAADLPVGAGPHVHREDADDEEGADEDDHDDGHTSVERAEAG